MTVEIKTLAAGLNPNNPQHPFTVAFIGNPCLELQSSGLVVDPIMSDKPTFDRCVDYSLRCLFGQLAGQREKLLAPPDIKNSVRVVSVYETGLTPTHTNCLVMEMSGVLAPMQSRLSPYLATHELKADIVFAITLSRDVLVSAAYDTHDDPSRGGVLFTLDGRTLTHAYYSSEPGCVALHANDEDLTPLHEFQHAVGSYTNGQVEDLYVDSGGRGLNKKKRNGSGPLPANFASLNGLNHATDSVRDHIGYPQNWKTYHCEAHNAAAPVVMDNYFLTTNSLDCENDTITREFLQQRIRVKMARP